AGAVAMVVAGRRLDVGVLDRDTHQPGAGDFAPHPAHRLPGRAARLTPRRLVAARAGDALDGRARGRLRRRAADLQPGTLRFVLRFREGQGDVHHAVPGRLDVSRAGPVQLPAPADGVLVSVSLP